MRVASAAGPAAFGAALAPAVEGVVLDVAGGRVELSRAEAEALRDAAAARAGSSSVARDLSLLLGRVLGRGHVLALRRVEARELVRVADEAGMADVSGRVRGVSVPGCR